MLMKMSAACVSVPTPMMSLSDLAETGLIELAAGGYTRSVPKIA